jgi:tetratricopeptide (TPR) repeat protein
LESRALCLNNIGCAYDYLEEYDKALQYYSESLTIMTNDIDKSMSYNNIGITYDKNGQYEQTFQSFEHSLAIRKKCLSSNNHHLGISYSNIALLFSSIEQFDRALKYSQRALKIFSLNHFDIFRGIVYQNMAQIFQEKNQLDQSIKLYQDAKNIFEQLRPTDHPNIIYIKQKIHQLKQQKQFIF